MTFNPAKDGNTLSLHNLMTLIFKKKKNDYIWSGLSYKQNYEERVKKNQEGCMKSTLHNLRLSTVKKKTI